MPQNSPQFFDYISILIVDSNADYRETLNAELRFAGFFNVITAPNNNVARHILARVVCNIAIIEFENDNTELLALLGTERHARTLVAASAYDRRVSGFRKETPKGIDIFLPKPTPRRDLVNAIARLLCTPIGWRGKVVLLPGALYGNPGTP